MNENVWITGIGLLSCLGQGAQNNFDALVGNKTSVDEKTYLPYPVHTLPEIQWDEQIPKRDIRQMGEWQIIGTYAAGLALKDAGLDAENEELNNKTDMIIAARGSAVDAEVGRGVMEIAKEKNDEEAIPMITQYLSDNLRPTFFLTQLPNLLAGNISIAHKITGSSRTFMGEEGAGIAALQTAYARIQHKQSEIILVGGAFTSECQETLLSMELGQRLYQGEHKPIIERQENKQNGMIMGSAGAFLVLESETHAKNRKANGYCKIEKIVSGNCNRENEKLKNSIEEMMKKIDNQPEAVLSGVSGMDDITKQELDVLEEQNKIVRCYGSRIGNSMEAHFPFGVALGALALKNNKFYEPFEKNEKEMKNDVENIMVTTIGASQAEGVAVVGKIEGE